MAKERAKIGRKKAPRAKKAVGASKPLGSVGATTTIVEATGRADQVQEHRGRVAGFSVGAQGLVIKLDVSAILRLAITVAADEPHFRSAVSMTMIAHNNRENPATSDGDNDHQYLWVKLAESTAGHMTRPALDVGLSDNRSASPFEIADFVTSPDQ